MKNLYSQVYGVCALPLRLWILRQLYQFVELAVHPKVGSLMTTNNSCNVFIFHRRHTLICEHEYIENDVSVEALHAGHVTLKLTVVYVAKEFTVLFK